MSLSFVVNFLMEDYEYKMIGDRRESFITVCDIVSLLMMVTKVQCDTK